MSDDAIADAVATLRDAATIRERCGHIADAVAAGDSEQFTLDPSQLPVVADRVAALARQRFPPVSYTHLTLPTIYSV